ncbi:hypothetical protein HMPREF1212_04771 [Parabacteroides sp. HGS0025]|uniref:hypothetical protein n=1 Tax=Parabacteroides sp. HGS0025 TaxID=1078087 RepID=UPI0006174612|nr:hypothetical protein [Parabacteroides sp. HGS0025]KKB46148.1 hypothetical protein HMPREF1212_04771 [Parabacteroides sp. HGS0025]
MKDYKQPVWWWLSLCILLCIGTACKDENETDEPLSSTSYYEGEFRFVNFHRKMAPGAYECYFTNREDKSELVVAAIVYSEEGEVVFIPESPVRTGDYYFNRAVLVKSDRPANEAEVGLDVPLGCEMSITPTACTLKEETPDPNLECYGSGTKDDPFRISSYAHLQNLMNLVNSTEENNKKYGDKYYIQTANLSLKVPCANLNGGWNSIGNHITRPFAGHYDGQGYKIKNMTVKRTGDIVPQPAGLFGIIINSSIRNVKLESSTIESDFAVAGMLVGAVVSTGDMRLTSGLSNCTVSSDCKIQAPYLVGGLVGGVNQNARLVMSKCTNHMPVTAPYQGVGGLIGAAFFASTVTLEGCTNTAAVTGRSGIVGGLIGSADTLMVNDCKNSGMIDGGINSIGTGGLVGGGLNVITSFSENRGTVTGDREVGGIIGSTARNSSEKTYGDTHVYTSGNYAEVKGNSEVGGLVGAAQILISGSYNFATVKASQKNVGGLAGLGPMAIIIGSTNDGDVSCYGSDEDSFTGGVLGSAQDYVITGSNNCGKVSNPNGKGTVGGILGGCDLLGIVSYCGNFGSVSADQGAAGGIIGRAGKPRNLTDKMIADMVLGTALSIATIGMSASEIPGAGGSKQKAAKMMARSLQIGIANNVLGALTSVNDFAWAIANNVVEESAVSRQQLEDLEYKRSSELEKYHNNRFNLVEIKSNHLMVSPGPYSRQLSNQRDFLGRINHADSKYQNNLNDWRNDVEDKMHAREEMREVAAHVGETIAFLGDIIGFCPVPNPVSIVVTAIVAFYNLVMNLTDYSYNRVGIIQCFNYGEVKASGKYFSGGIAGELHDYARILDSANFGPVEGDHAGYMFGKGGHLPAVERSLNLRDDGALFYKECEMYSSKGKNIDVREKGADVFEKKTYTLFNLEKEWEWLPFESLPAINRSTFE